MYLGAHGTCASAAQRIRKHGFECGVGLRGFGVYFWSYKKVDYKVEADSLAVSWWRFAKEKKGLYAKWPDKSCSIINCSFSLIETDVFDFENFREDFVLYADVITDKFKDVPNGKDKDKYFSSLYDAFLESIEEKIEHKFKAVLTKVQPPNGHVKRIPIDITGQPSCLIVKNKDSINIENIENPNL